MAVVRITDNSRLVKAELEKKIPILLEEWGLAGEGFAKKEITKVVYDTPQSPYYTRTGNLRDSLTHTKDKTTAYIGTNIEYAAFVEMGTSRMRARPYLRPAVENYVDKYKELMKIYLT